MLRKTPPVAATRSLSAVDLNESARSVCVTILVAATGSTTLVVEGSSAVVTVTKSLDVVDVGVRSRSPVVTRLLAVVVAGRSQTTGVPVKIHQMI